jgi:hypothetical protein
MRAAFAEGQMCGAETWFAQLIVNVPTCPDAWLAIGASERTTLKHRAAMYSAGARPTAVKRARSLVSDSVPSTQIGRRLRVSERYKGGPLGGDAPVALRTGYWRGVTDQVTAERHRRFSVSGRQQRQAGRRIRRNRRPHAAGRIGEPRLTSSVPTLHRQRRPLIVRTDSPSSVPTLHRPASVASRLRRGEQFRLAASVPTSYAPSSLNSM